MRLMDDGNESDKERGVATGIVQSRMQRGGSEVMPCPVAESD